MELSISWVYIILIISNIFFKIVFSDSIIFSELNCKGKKYYKKHVSKNFIKRIFFWNFKDDISTVDFIINIIFIIFFIITSVVFVLLQFGVLNDTNRGVHIIGFADACFIMIIFGYRILISLIKVIFKK